MNEKLESKKAPIYESDINRYSAELLDNRMQRICMFVALICMLCVSISYLFIDGVKIIVLGNFIGCIWMLLCIALDHIPRFRNWGLTIALPFFSYFYIPVLWLASGGVTSSLPVMAIFLLVVITLSKKSKIRTILLITYACILIGLVVHDFYRPQISDPIVLNNTITRTIVFFGISPAIWYLLEIQQKRNSHIHRSIYHQSITDNLTGCSNRRFCAEQLYQLKRQYYTDSTNYAIILIDIDDFKHINDAYGHLVGDIVLIQLGKSIKSCVRKSDIAIRFGGDEFLILLPNSDQSQAKKLAERLLMEVRQLTFPQISEPLTVSIGIIDAVQADMLQADILRQVDRRMYAAKHSGRNCIVCG